MTDNSLTFETHLNERKLKLWQKSNDSLEAVTKFSSGNDSEMDMYLAKYDVLGSLAHINMLESVGHFQF